MPHRLLVVDDQEDMRELFSAFLEMRGYDVRSASDGVEAVARARAFHPDVILMDLAMPNMDGREATQILRRDPATRGITILMVTGHARAAAPRDVCPECDDVLLKPIDLAWLADRVAEAIASRG